MCLTRIVFAIDTTVESVKWSHEQCIVIAIIQGHTAVFSTPSSKFYAVKARFCYITYIDNEIDGRFWIRDNEIWFYLFEPLVKFINHFAIVITLLLIPVMKISVAFMSQGTKNILTKRISTEIRRIFSNRFFIAQRIVCNDGANAKATSIPNLRGRFKTDTTTFDTWYILIRQCPNTRCFLAFFVGQFTIGFVGNNP